MDERQQARSDEWERKTRAVNGLVTGSGPPQAVFRDPQNQDAEKQKPAARPRIDLLRAAIVLVLLALTAFGTDFLIEGVILRQGPGIVTALCCTPVLVATVLLMVWLWRA